MKRRAFLASAGLGAGGCDLRQADAAIQGGFTGTRPERGHTLRDRWAHPTDLPIAANSVSHVNSGMTSEVTRRTQVIIAGGGIAGLAAARGLRLRGVDDFALFDLEDSTGGNSRAGNVGGITCPLGAHYLPVPGDDASEVQDFLEELGLRQRVAGRWQYDERHVCHSPQERLFFNGQWQEGLLPVAGVGRSTLRQYQRFASLVDAAQRADRFAIPAFKVPLRQSHQSLDAITFEAWLIRQGLDDPHLRWYLNYCCRDDYGAGSATVSAWAGLHYFASRHGFQPPEGGTAVGDTSDLRQRDAGVLTWPDGNATLARALATPSGERLHTGCLVLRVNETRHGVEVDVLRHATNAVECWRAERCIVALPAFIAARVVVSPPGFVAQAARHLRYAAWAVANIHLREPLQDRPGAAPAWDNVPYDADPMAEGAKTAGGLGYVDARHQSLDPRPGPTVLTHYRALGDQPQARQQLQQQPWSYWRDQTLADLVTAHPDLPSKATRIDITRYGHAMCIPTPGAQSFLRKNDSYGMKYGQSLLLKKKQTGGHPLATARLRFAHSDWSGYSIFEEAFTRGHWAGLSAW